MKNSILLFLCIIIVIFSVFMSFKPAEKKQYDVVEYNGIAELRIGMSDRLTKGWKITHTNATRISVTTYYTIFYEK